MSSDFYQMHVFFFISSVGFVLLALILAIVLIYLARILSDIKYITQKARTEADILSGELSELRQNVREQGAKLKYFSSFFSNIYKKSKKS